MNQKTESFFKLYPIGYIRNSGERFFIEIEKKFVPAMKQIEHFSHLQVLCWFHEHDNKKGRENLKDIPPYKGAPETGVFASRSPARPNPIALSTVVMVNADTEKGIIDLAYTDAHDGTPVVDLKPYMPICDRAREVRMPEWLSHWPEWIPEGDFDPEEYGFIMED